METHKWPPGMKPVNIKVLLCLSVVNGPVIKSA